MKVLPTTFLLFFLRMLTSSQSAANQSRVALRDAPRTGHGCDLWYAAIRVNKKRPRSANHVCEWTERQEGGETRSFRH